jgi:hypothetical protein
MFIWQTVNCLKMAWMWLIALKFLSVEVHIGNSDLVALFIYKNSKMLLDIIIDIEITRCKQGTRV